MDFRALMTLQLPGKIFSGEKSIFSDPFPKFAEGNNLQQNATNSFSQP